MVEFHLRQVAVLIYKMSIKKFYNLTSDVTEQNERESVLAKFACFLHRSRYDDLVTEFTSYLVSLITVIIKNVKLYQLNVSKKATWEQFRL